MFEVDERVADERRKRDDSVGSLESYEAAGLAVSGWAMEISIQACKRSTFRVNLEVIEPISRTLASPY